MLPNLMIEEATGDVVSPDKISTEFSGSFGAFAIESKLVTVGDNSYVTNPLNGRWESVPVEVSPLGFFNPRKGIAAMMSRVEKVQLSSVTGGTYQLQGTLAAEALAPLLGTALTDATVMVQLTIDGQEFYLLEAVLSGKVAPADPEGTVRVITLSQFNEPIAIEPPV